MQDAIWPIVQELIKRTPKKEQKPGQGQGQGMGMPGQGLPQFSDLTPEQVNDLIKNLPQGSVLPASANPNPGEPNGPKANVPSSSQPTGPMTDEDRNKAAQDYQNKLDAIKEQRSKEIALNEPLNERLMAVSAYAKMMAKKLIDIFRSPEEPSLDHAKTGIFIDPIPFILHEQEAFMEETENLGKPNLAIGLTIDRSGSMGKYREATEQLMALFIEAFQAIDKSKGQFSVNYFDGQYHDGKGFAEKFPAGDLNGYFAKMVAEFRKGGSTSIYAAVEGIIEKYRNVTQKNKVEVILTDGQGGDMTWNAAANRYVPSNRLKAKLEEAKRMGVQIIAVGFGTAEVSVFDRFIQLDQNNALSLVEIIIKVAQQSTVGQILPLGDLSKAYSSTIHRSLEARREVGRGKDEAMLAKKEEFLNVLRNQYTGDPWLWDRLKGASYIEISGIDQHFLGHIIVTPEKYSNQKEAIEAFYKFLRSPATREFFN